VRKQTTPLHIIAGIFAACLYNWLAGLAITLVIGFGVYEYWEEHKLHDTGCKDFWEFLFGLFIGAAFMLILKLVR